MDRACRGADVSAPAVVDTEVPNIEDRLPMLMRRLTTALVIIGSMIVVRSPLKADSAGQGVLKQSAGAAVLGRPGRPRGRADRRRAGRVRGRALRSLPAEHRSAVRHVPQPEPAGRRAGRAALVRQPRRAYAAAGRSRLLRRVRHAASVGLQGRRARRRVAGHHRRLAVGVHPRARQRLVRRLDRLRPDLQRRAGGRVRGARRSGVPAARSVRSSGCCPT